MICVETRESWGAALDAALTEYDAARADMARANAILDEIEHQQARQGRRGWTRKLLRAWDRARDDYYAAADRVESADADAREAEYSIRLADEDMDEEEGQ